MRTSYSRKGLSPLLAIIIGLVVTIIAGILLAQLYFSYAATISSRPAANIEYIDLIENGDKDILIINVKNVGNLPIDVNQVRVSALGCAFTPDSGTVEPGETLSISCQGTFVDNSGDVWSGHLNITFVGDGTQVYAISVRARSA